MKIFVIFLFSCSAGIIVIIACHVPVTNSNTSIKNLAPNLNNLILTKSQHQSARFNSIINEDKNPTVCPLKVTIDHLFYQKFTSRSGEDIIKWTTAILRVVDDVYRKSDFDMDGKPDGIRLLVKEFVIWRTNEDRGYSLYGNYKQTHDDCVRLMHKHSLENTSNVCASLLLTGRQCGNTMGISMPRNKGSGICSESKVSLVTYFASGFPFPFVKNDFYARSIAEHLIIHEIGHSFGAGHDTNTTECKQNGGVYVMDTAGFDKMTTRNHEFSLCSRRDIKSKFDEFGKECFETEKEFNHCGNAFIDDPNEECDCGQKEQCDKIDPCCTPRGGLLYDKECTYRRNSSAECSDREDKCCTTSCRVVPKQMHQQCNMEETCQIPSFCDGLSKDCHRIGNKPDGTSCRRGLGVCQSGICEDAICRTSKLDGCICSDILHICELCCSNRGVCIPAKLWGIVNNTGNAYLVPDGEYCYVGNGVCRNGQCMISGVSKNLAFVGSGRSGFNRLYHYRTDDFYYNILAMFILNGTIFIVLVGSVILAKRYIRSRLRHVDNV